MLVIKRESYSMIFKYKVIGWYLNNIEKNKGNNDIRLLW